ncbi:unnamed protein product [Cyprideis torosa]|uniref:Uncharacterized protein n=1 Tax=Cyprideis torosa TaxID=163714 RepID=A0A7R8W794_9CRUS|nr:unnamed protein product [Cyprideis torosa]CAG0884964.1 unnamed protein product [Cyprideis torosa]
MGDFAENLNILTDVMGFNADLSRKALKEGGGSVEGAVTWIEEHPNALASASAEATAPLKKTSPDSENVPEQANGAEAPKSIKCDECGKLFSDMTYVELHSHKTGHSAFSESTEEKAPLTPEEKARQMALLEQKLAEKKAARLRQEAEAEKLREINRIKQGKETAEAKRRHQEMEAKRIADELRRQKMEEAEAKRRVLAQIEEDKRRRQAATQQDQSTTPAQTSPPRAEKVPAAPAPAVHKYDTTRIQIRLDDGTVLQHTFNASEELAAVRLFIQTKRPELLEKEFVLLSTFPRRTYENEDWMKPLSVLGLVPSASLILRQKPTAM